MTRVVRDDAFIRIDSYEKQLVDTDVSAAGIVSAADQVFQKTGHEINMLLTSPANYHEAERAIALLHGRFQLLPVVLTNRMRVDEWAVGVSYIEDSFVGSEGA